MKNPQQVKNLHWKHYTYIMLRKNRKSIQFFNRHNAHISNIAKSIPGNLPSAEP